MTFLRLAALAVVLPVVVATSPFAWAHDYRVGELSIAHPWSRATPPGARVGAGYVKIDNRGAVSDRLISATMERAGRAEGHEMSVTDGVMRMRELAAGVPIPANGSVELKPRGLHVMFVDLKSPLLQGERIKGSLIFERAGAVAVEFAVEPIGAASAARHDH